MCPSSLGSDGWKGLEPPEQVRAAAPPRLPHGAVQPLPSASCFVQVSGSPRFNRAGRNSHLLVLRGASNQTGAKAARLVAPVAGPGWLSRQSLWFPTFGFLFPWAGKVRSVPSAGAQRAGCSNALGSFWGTRTRVGLCWGIAVQVNGEDLQTGPALSSTPFPPFLIAIPSDLSGLPGNKNTRAFLVNAPGIVHVKFAGGAVPCPGERKPLAALRRDELSPCAQTWPCSCGSSTGIHQCGGSTPSVISFSSLLAVI